MKIVKMFEILRKSYYRNGTETSTLSTSNKFVNCTTKFMRVMVNNLQTLLKK